MGIDVNLFAGATDVQHVQGLYRATRLALGGAEAGEMVRTHVPWLEFGPWTRVDRGQTNASLTFWYLIGFKRFFINMFIG